MSATLIKQVEAAAAYVQGVKESLQAQIAALPDNPRIKRLAPKNCFVIMFSDLGDNWSPSHHDFRVQYRRIIAEIDRRGLDSVVTLFREVIEQGWIRETSATREKFTFHPDVIIHLAHIAGIPIPPPEAFPSRRHLRKIESILSPS